MPKLFLSVLLATILYGQTPVGTRPFRIEELRTQPGYEVSIYARNLRTPRFMAFGPNGVLYVAARGGNSIVAVSKADKTIEVLRGINQPDSLVFNGTDLFIGLADGVVRLRNAVTEDLMIRTQPERLIFLPAVGGHSSRTVTIGADGKLYVSMGSTCNLCNETDPRRAAITRYEADGSGQTLFARGLRNSVGMAWHPVTGQLWATENGGDGLGDDQPPEEINIVRQNVDYGWPDCIGKQRTVAWGPAARPARCPDTEAPELEIQAHSAPLGLSFYTGTQFPVAVLNNAFAAFHGSWNRNTPTGYKVVRILAGTGKAEGLEDFLWGFLDLNTRTTSGRPVHAEAGPDGSLYVSDDATGNIYRVKYVGPRINPGGIVCYGRSVCELYGANLMDDIKALKVTANGQAVELLYISPGQINFALPEGIASVVAIKVENAKATDVAVVQLD